MATILAQDSDALENVIFRADFGTNSQNSMRHTLTLCWPRLQGRASTQHQICPKIERSLPAANLRSTSDSGWPA